jgi:hypothetical protein
MDLVPKSKEPMYATVASKYTRRFLKKPGAMMKERDLSLVDVFRGDRYLEGKTRQALLFTRGRSPPARAAPPYIKYMLQHQQHIINQHEITH